MRPMVAGEGVKEDLLNYLTWTSQSQRGFLSTDCADLLDFSIFLICVIFDDFLVFCTRISLLMD
ncbi:hypothetical protein MNBD_CHLOROFLEXI01-4730 [hydrothermal vent metagenome]|uniref:Uncharacterized protein n=1 Tax=hydrothermal vent metagenome TaxID=652676 RepID=A0A3B0VVA9_9ZZZZ